MSVKENGYSSAKLHAKRDKKRQESEARQRAYNQLSLTQRLQLAVSRGGSKKELDKLNKKIELEKKPQPVLVQSPTPAVAETPKKKKPYQRVKRS